MTSWLPLLLACGAPAPVEAPAPAPEAAPVEEAPAVRFDAEPILPEPVVLGRLPRTAIDGALASQREALAACHASGARPGKVLVYFVVDADGSVKKASVRSTSLRDDTAEACVLEVVRGTRFAAPEGGGIVVVTYPFVFPLA
ncbi:MAG: TonB family protein [Alphaproteobacteria bacterium]|nr:TonB family protein [Alphaproteobacteria bacterium]